MAFALTGAGALSATENDAPFAVPAELVAGTYRIVATPYAAAGGSGAAGTALELTGVTVAVAAVPVTGFTLLDAQGELTDPDVGALGGGATVDLTSLGGWASVRANLVASTPATRVALALRGPRSEARTVTVGGVVSLFGESGGEHVLGVFTDGVYTLTATPYAGPDPRDLLPATTVSFTVTGGLKSAVTGFTLVDAVGGLPDPDLGALAHGTTVDLSATGGWASVRAELEARRPDVQGVALTLRGPREADRTVLARAPVSLFGDTGGDYVAGAFPDGAYTLTARPLAGGAYAFTGGVAGWTEYGGTWRAANGAYRAGLSGVGESKAALDGFEAADVLVEADMRLTSGSGNAGVIFRVSDPQPGLNAFRGYYAGAGNDSRVVLGRIGGGWQELGSATLVYEEGRWYRLRVVAAGSAIRVHVDGALVLEAEDDTYASGSVGLRSSRAAAEWDNVTVVRLDEDPAAALPEMPVAFTVTGGVPSALTGFTLLDAADGASDADLGTLADGATLDLSSSTTGAVTVRADVAVGRTDIGSMVFELRGPRNVDRAVDAGTPWRLFGPGGNTLPNGSYMLTARAYAEAGGTGDALSVTTVTFTVTGSHAADAAAVTGFTLVDAAGGLPDPDLGALADGATVDLLATGGWASIRAELAARRPDVKDVVLALRPGETDRTVRAEAPVSLFGAAGGDYVAGAFLDGAYTLTARPLAGSVTRSYGFAGGAAGWTEYGRRWSSANGVYRSSGIEGRAALDGFEAADVLLEADVRHMSGGGTVGVIFRVGDSEPGRDAFRGYYAGLGRDSPLVLGRMDDGVWQELGTAALFYEKGRWYRLRVVAAGSAIRVHVDGALVLEVEDDTYASGPSGCGTCARARRGTT